MKQVVVICGPTASGKSDVAMHIATACNGEIICADSRTIYKGMDIGTAKPSAEERQKITHHLLDICEPGQLFSAHAFQQAAQRCIADIQARGKLPIVVGGTGLYIDALLYNYTFTSQHSPIQRDVLEKMTMEELYIYCEKNNIELPENYKNKRYVVRNIERNGYKGQRSQSILSNYIVVGITTEKEILKQRIVRRIEQMLLHGVVEEATILGKRYGWESAAMRANIYGLIKSYVLNELTKQQLIERAATLDWHLAKRQLTWLKRNRDIAWLRREEVVDYVVKHLE